MVETVRSVLLLLPTFHMISDKPPPTKEVRDIIDYCHSRKKQLIIGCDASAHTHCGGALAAIQEEKASWNFW
jgi:hypothetical protein